MIIFKKTYFVSSTQTIGNARSVLKLFNDPLPSLALTDRDKCQVNNGGCEHSCKNTVGSFMCCCSPGYRLRRDGRTCQDVNECEFHNGGCSHECANTVGSYRCLCGPGSRLMPDGRTCVGEASCGVRNGGCDHYCDDTAGRPKCSCRPG
ncbi:multiple epidermal growth factor-like domains protein 6 isoform X2 [Scylla paramamosain]|uniref:multiple epidermal growth factor-like domains protein 6 isoform X2 n=1 Tax=Scylla paramamosain TaxID=85552 RepID=UPI003083215D